MIFFLGTISILLMSRFRLFGTATSPQPVIQNPFPKWEKSSNKSFFVCRIFETKNRSLSNRNQNASKPQTITFVSFFLFWQSSTKGISLPPVIIGKTNHNCFLTWSCIVIIKIFNFTLHAHLIVMLNDALLNGPLPNICKEYLEIRLKKKIKQFKELVIHLCKSFEFDKFFKKKTC